MRKPVSEQLYRDTPKYQISSLARSARISEYR